jgi:uncharacterized protein involved in type VI secretion and phage assembly
MTGVYDQLFAGAAEGGLFLGVAVGVVTNVSDPEKRGRVKLKLPWLSDEIETDWARVASPSAGKQRGLYLPPEVDDEVLVGFEHGSPARPFVLGSLWNSVDALPEPPDGNRPAQVRMLKSVSGHIVRLVDKSGSEKIEILDKSGKNTIVIDTTKNSVTITADADLILQSTNGKVAIKGKSVQIEADSDLAVTSSGKGEVSAKGTLAVKGAVVNIN